MRARLASILAVGLAACLPGHARAQSDLIGLEAFDATLDLRASVVGGETGWLDGGFGKLRYGGTDDEGTAPRARIASADLAWKPQFGWNFSGLVSVTWQPDLPTSELGLSEAFVKFRSNPANTRFSARAGVFWPPRTSSSRAAGPACR